MKLSILIPVFNEENTILSILEEIKKQNFTKFDYEIIVINDGSTDNTQEILEKNPSMYDSLYKLEVNSGKGAAIIKGLQNSTGDYIIFQDADLEYSPKDYKKIISVIDKFNAEVVIGSRFLSPEYTRVHNFSHKLGNKFITLLFNILNNTTFTDIYSCYLCFEKSLLDIDKLKSKGWEQHAEILCNVVQKSKIHYEVPVSYSGRSYEEGKKIRGRHSFKVILMILKKSLF